MSSVRDIKFPHSLEKEEAHSIFILKDLNSLSSRFLLRHNPLFFFYIFTCVILHVQVTFGPLPVPWELGLGEQLENC